jgi:DNA-binding NarL/FixJ family response regulator
VVQLVRQALGNREISEKLGITESAVKAHLHLIFQKTGVESRTQLAIRAAEWIGD